MNAVAELDIGSLGWVKQEVDTALDRAAEALRRMVADSSNGAILGLTHGHVMDPGNDAQDRAQLISAREHIHQALGALLMVGMSEGVLHYVRTLEQLLADVEDAVVHWQLPVEQALQEGIAALRNYLDDVAGGQPDQPLRLFAAYQDMVVARNQPEALPSDLFFPDLARQPPRRVAGAPSLSPEMRLAKVRAVRGEFERGLLKWIRNDLSGVSDMRGAVAAIEAVQETPQARALWWVAMAFFDAVGAGALPDDDPQIKRHGARLDAQIKRMVSDNAEAPDRLLRDTLYWVAIARPAGAHVAQVVATYDLARHVPAGGFAANAQLRGKRPALRSAREQLAGAMEEWGRFCSGTAVALPAFHESIERFVARAIELAQPDLKKLGAALLAYAGQLRKDPLRMDEVAGLEVATALLLAESALDNFAALGADFSRQADVVANRLAQVTLGHLPASGKAPDLDTLNKRGMETRLVGFVAREIIANLAVVEQTLDAYFRNPQARSNELASLKKPLKQIEGALVVLDQERAGDVLRTAEATIQRFMAADYVPHREDFETLATQFCALGFFAEKLQRGNADIDAILDTGALASAAATADAAENQVAGGDTDASAPSVVTEQQTVPALPPAAPAAAPALALTAEPAADEEILTPAAPILGAAALPSPVAFPTLAEVVTQTQLPATRAEIPTETPTDTPAAATAASVEPELLEIFVEEAHEVLANLAVTQLRLEAANSDREALITVRRGFHTLKGSSRMVGLSAFGEVAWQIEALLNGWLAQERPATPPLLRLLGQAVSVFSAWVVALEESRTAPDTASLLQQCAQIGATLTEAPLPAPSLAPAPVPAPAPAVAPAIAAPAAVTVTVTPEPEADSAAVFAEPLHSLYLEEATALLATLRTAVSQSGTPSKEAVRAAHTLGSISSTAHLDATHALARALENALARFHRLDRAQTPEQLAQCEKTVTLLEEMVTSVGKRCLPGAQPEWVAVLDAMTPPPPTPSAVAPAHHLSAQDAKLAASDDIDQQLLPLFLEEAQDLMHAIGETLRQWREVPAEAAVAERLQRELHTLKGSARMVGAMRLGELVHAMENRLVHNAGQAARPELLDELDSSFDRVAALVDVLRGVPPENLEDLPGAATETTQVLPPAESGTVAAAMPLEPIQPHLRVRADLVDRLVDEAGEIGIARARIENEMRGLKTSLLELTDNVIRLRNQLREIEIQAETQMQSRRADAEGHERAFDPLELDRFTRFQELTRMMAESVNDVSTVQHNLRRNLDQVSVALSAQGRLNRALSQALMNVRMVPFGTLVDRLHRVVRQTAKQRDRRVSLDIHGSQVEIDRSVLERITAPLEHLLRNAVAHGIESAETRTAQGKPARGSIDITVLQDGNEIVLTVADDGAGVNLERIRAIAAERALLPATDLHDDNALVQLLLRSGFSTSSTVDEISGRGVGMSVVANEITSLGGRLEINNRPGRGMSFRIGLPLTLSVLQAVLVRAAGRTYAIPAAMVEQASELKPQQMLQLRTEGGSEWLGNRYPWHYLPHVLGETAAQPQRALRHWVLLLKGKEDTRIALEVDGMLGNQEIVVKNIGPQLAHIAGIAGATVLGDGEIALILKPVELALRQQATPLPITPAALPVAAPIVMIVDDSLTVRKITGRLLTREGYQVLTAKDGKDALDQMGDLVPDLVLTDIEMPRMDGFELARTMRGSSRLKPVPIIMITSRIADKHRDYAEEIGVDHYLGKPYSEETLLTLVRRLAPATTAMGGAAIN